MRLPQGIIDTVQFELVPPSPINKNILEYYYLGKTITHGLFSRAVSLLFTPIEINQNSNYGSAMQIVDKQPKQTINGVEYSNTITTFHIEQDYVISEVYAENVGVVMRVYADSSVFVLKDYFINR